MKATGIVCGLALIAAVAGCTSSPPAGSGPRSGGGSTTAPASTSVPANPPSGKAKSGLWKVAFVEPPLAGDEHKGSSLETIVVNPDGTVDTYTFAGALARAEYINTPGGVAEGTWGPDGKMTGAFDLSCSSSDDVVDTQRVPGHSKPMSANLGVVPGACTGGHMTALGYAKAFARNGHWSFAVVKAR